MTESLVKLPVERIEQTIFVIRSERVMLDRDLAALYGVSTKTLNQAVKRHKDRFPDDFMFQLTMKEARAWWSERSATRLRSQNVTLKTGQHIKYRPYAFTEHGILMLSSVLNSERAIAVNIEIMRAFVRLRQMLSSNVELALKLAELEKKYDRQFKIVFDAIRELMTYPTPKRKEIGFRATSAKDKRS
jgi:ORF6N domain-containing protein